ncbi:LysR substrate-binding domain-containing protein [Paracoccaceae bacterium GXU_MW_L88]
MSSHMIELNQLRYFVAVAEELNFRRAAKRLNMTQPPLSRHIALLEHKLGTPLFDRTNRSVRLTAAGKRLLQDASDILTRTESAVLTARQAALGAAGSVDIGFVPSASIEVIPRITRRIRAELPDVTIILSEVMTFEAIEALGSGGLDLGIIRLPRESNQLPMEKIWSEPFVLAIHKGDPLLSHDHIRVENLHNHDFIGYSSARGGFLAEVINGCLKARGIVPRELYTVAQQHTVLGLVNEGIGAALVPRSSSAIALPNVAFRKIDIHPNELHSDLYLAKRPTEPEPVIAAVAQIIRDELSDEILPRRV